MLQHGEGMWPHWSPTARLNALWRPVLVLKGGTHRRTQVHTCWWVRDTTIMIWYYIVIGMLHPTVHVQVMSCLSPLVGGLGGSQVRHMRWECTLYGQCGCCSTGKALAEQCQVRLYAFMPSFHLGQASCCILISRAPSYWPTPLGLAGSVWLVAQQCLPGAVVPEGIVQISHPSWLYSFGSCQWFTSTAKRSKTRIFMLSGFKFCVVLGMQSMRVLIHFVWLECIRSRHACSTASSAPGVCSIIVPTSWHVFLWIDWLCRWAVCLIQI